MPTERSSSLSARWCYAFIGLCCPDSESCSAVRVLFLSIKVISKWKESRHMADKKRRSMKVISQSGYKYRETPTIILKGMWLDQFNFHIGDYVSVTCEDGKLIITPDVEKASMVEMSPALLKRSKLMTATKRIVNYGNAGYYQVLSAEVGGKHGFSVSGLVFDEIHTQPNRQLYDVLTKGSSDARQNPLHFIITTAGTDRHSIAYEFIFAVRPVMWILLRRSKRSRRCRMVIQGFRFIRTMTLRPTGMCSITWGRCLEVSFV